MWFLGESRSTGREPAAPPPPPPPPTPFDKLAKKQRSDLAKLRLMAMKLVEGLDRIALGKAGEPDGHLLGKSDGVIDGFNTMAQIVSRLIDKERQTFNLADDQSATLTASEPGIDRRIADELDRIASRGGAPRGAGTDRPDQ